MKAQDFRLGNFINHEQTTHKIVALGDKFCHSVWTKDLDWTYQHSYEEIKPIPLTEDWLLKFGFTKYEWCDDCAFINFNGAHMMLRYYNNEWHCDKTKVTSDSRGQRMSNGSPILKKGLIKYVHQLQNLYFALTCKELSLTASTPQRQ